METFSQSKTMVDDHNNVKFKSLYIDLDLAMPRNSNSPRAVRRLQKSLDSHEEFEFTMSSNISMKDDIFEPAMEVASADKLFFRGQLVPLQQQDPLHHLAHTMVFPKEEICGEKGASFSRHYGDLLSFQLPNEEKYYSCEVGFPKLQFSSQIGTCHPIMKQAASYEEGVIPPEFSLRDQIDLMRSCRLDGVFDPYKNDSRSSSFRSHQSSYWSSGEKDSRDSISSSRCSIGSYQDSCFQSAERKAPQISVIKANHPINTNANAEINECNIGVFYANEDPKHSRNNYRKPPIPSSNTRKWSWKGFFTGLGKASKVKTDEERGDKGKVKGKLEIKEMNKRSVFTFKELPGVMGEPASYNRRSDAGQDWEWQANTYQFVCSEGSSVKKGRKPAAREDNYEDQGTVYCLRSGGRQEAASSFINGSSSSSMGNNIVGEGNSTATKKEKRKVLQGNTSTWNARESWNKCVNKVKKGTRLSTYNNSSSACKLQPKQLIALQGGKNMNAAMNLMNEEDQKMDIYRVNYMKAKSLSSTPLAKSPVRRAHEYNGISSGGGGYGSLYCMQGGGAASLAASSSSASASSTMSKTMNKKVGFAASCPASMRSSPHHSGLLAVVNKATPDIHTAIQGAIAYCKQSQAALNPP